MKSNRSAESRRRHRRTEDELISALHAKIAMLEQKKSVRSLRQDPILKLADKLVRSLKKAEASFQSNGRLDLANSAKAAVIQISQCIKQTNN